MKWLEKWLKKSKPAPNFQRYPKVPRYAGITVYHSAHGFTGFIQGAHALEAVEGPVPAPRASTGAEARGTAWELRIGGQSRGTHPGAIQPF